MVEGVGGVGGWERGGTGGEGWEVGCEKREGMCRVAGWGGVRGRASKGGSEGGERGRERISRGRGMRRGRERRGCVQRERVGGGTNGE